MWWGGGGGNDPPDVEETSPIPIRGGGNRDEANSSLSSSVGSSYGSPSSDLTELRNLRSQFDDQEALLGQIRDALQSNSKKGKKSEKEDYASRLAQMRQNRKGGAGCGSSMHVASSTPLRDEKQESVSPPSGKKSRGAKMQILRKQLEETRARQEAEAASRKDLEEIVMGLQKEITKRDSMIASLQLSSVNSSVISSPFVMSPEAVSPSDSPGNLTPPSYGFPYDIREQLSAKDNKILELSEQVAELGRKVFDLEENCKEKDEIISARTQAVGLTAASLSAKGKNTLEQLEDTQDQLRQLQERWAGQEVEWRKEKEENKVEIECLQSKVSSLTEERVQLETVREELEAKSRDLREEIGGLEREVAEGKRRSREEKIRLEARLEEVEEAREKEEKERANREKLHLDRVCQLERRLRQEAKEAGEEAERVVDLEIGLAEAEEEKGNLQLRIIELEEAAANEIKLKSQLSEADLELRRFQDDLECQTRAVAMLESEKLDLMEALATRDEQLTQRSEAGARLCEEVESVGRARVALEMRCLELEELRDRWEGERLEFVQSIEAEKLASREALKPLEVLQQEHEALSEEHERFKQEHAAALERSQLYDKDLMEKYTKIRELNIEMSTLEKMLEEKNVELAANFGEIEVRDVKIAELTASLEARDTQLKENEGTIDGLKYVIAESENQQFVTGLQLQVETAQARLIELEVACDQLRQEVQASRMVNNDLENRLKQMEIEKDKVDSTVMQLQLDHEGLVVSLKENETEKESLNSALEENIRARAKAEEEVETLADKVKLLEKALEDNREAFKNLTDSEKIHNQNLTSELADLGKQLEEERLRMAEMVARMEVKDKEQQEIENKLNLELSTLSTELSAEREKFLVKSIELEASINQLNEENLQHLEKIAHLETEVSLKTEDIYSLNEDILAKYKVIEDLQTELDRVCVDVKKQVEMDEVTATLNTSLAVANAENVKLAELLETERTNLLHLEKEKVACIAVLQGELAASSDDAARHASDLESKNIAFAKLEVELQNKQIAMATMQTVLDVLQADNSDEKNAELSALEQRAAELQAKLVDKSRCLEEISDLYNSECDKRRALETEVSESDTTLAQCRAELSRVRSELSEQTERAELAESKSADIEIDENNMVKLQQEQIEMLRIQLKEKAELLDKSSSDVNRRKRVEELTELLELKEQEVEDIRALMRRSEAKQAELEQFRQELVKESNQHAEEAGEKIREIKSQLDTRVEECFTLVTRISQLEEELEAVSSCRQGSKQKADVVEAGIDVSALVAERDSLKEKNEKLKDMCKKYLAKLKQKDASERTATPTMDNTSNPKVEKLQAEVSSLTQENGRLEARLEELNSLVNSLETEIQSVKTARDQEVIEAAQRSKDLSEECVQLKTEARERDAALAKKDDLVRELKEKLENSPENITVTVPDLAAFDKTKSELLAMREKCKKLIVKVKQQDELLKKKSSLAESAVPRVDADIGPLESLKAEVDNLKANMSEKDSQLSQQTEQLSGLNSQLATLTSENSQLRRKLFELEEDSSTMDSLKSKIETLIGERTSLYDDQIKHKEEIASLKVERQAALATGERLEAEIRRMREEKIVSEMQSSSLLLPQTSESGGFGGFPEEDDGWGSPEPPIGGTVVQKEQHVMAAVDTEAAEESCLQQVAPVQDEDNCDGWRVGGSASLAGDQAGDGWSDDGGWGEDAVASSEVAVLGNKSEVAQEEVRPSGGSGGEREADIEDGWGDDTWGGFEASTEDGLAANLRLSVAKDDEGLKMLSRESSPGKGTFRQEDASPRSLALQCKVAEKESEFESLESEYNLLKKRFEDVEEELNDIQEGKDELERRASHLEREKERLEAVQLELEERDEKHKAIIANLEDAIKRSEEKMTATSSHESEVNRLTAELAASQVERMKEKEAAKTTTHQLQEVQERYHEAEERVRHLESKVSQQEEEVTKLAQQTSQKSEKVEELEAELTKLNEELEAVENEKTDLRERLKHSQEMRESIESEVPSRVTELEQELAEKCAMVEQKLLEANQQIEENVADIAAKESEIAALRSDIVTREAEMGDLRKCEEELMLDRSYKQEELAGVRAELVASDQEKGHLSKELASLRSFLSDLSSENESLRANLDTHQNQEMDNRSRIDQLQAELERLRSPSLNNPPPPPPDVTHGGSQPDVARSSTRGQNPPDLMPGQLDLVTQNTANSNNAASWFDTFDVGQGDGWGDQEPENVVHVENLYPEERLLERQASHDNPVRIEGTAEEVREVAGGQREDLAEERLRLLERIDRLTQETARLQQQLSDFETRTGILEREKAVLEQSQTQLLAEYKDFYEKATRYEETAGSLQLQLEQREAELQEKSSRIETLTTNSHKQDNLQDEIVALRENNQSLSAQCMEYWTQIDQLQKKINETSQQQETGGAGQSDAASNEELGQLQRSNHMLVSQLEAMKLEMENQRVNFEKKALNLDTLSSNTETFEVFKEEVLHLSEDNKMLSSQADAMQTELVNQKLEFERKAIDLNSLAENTELFGSLQEEVVNLRKTNQYLTTQLQSLNNQLQTLGLEQEQRLQSSREGSGEVDTLRQSNVFLTSQVEVLSNQLLAQSNELEEKSTRIEALKAQCDANTANILPGGPTSGVLAVSPLASFFDSPAAPSAIGYFDQPKPRTDFSAELAKKQAEVEELSSQLEHMRQGYKDKETELQVVSNQLEYSLSEKQALSKARNELVSKVESLTAEIQCLQSTMAETQNLNHSVIDLTRSLKEKEDEVLHLRQQVEELKSSIDSLQLELSRSVANVVTTVSEESGVPIFKQQTEVIAEPSFAAATTSDPFTSSTSAGWEATAPQELCTASHLFETSTTADLFSSPADGTGDLFSNPQNQQIVQQNPQLDSQTEPVAEPETKSDVMEHGEQQNLDWLNQELANYQQALVQWQAWGEEKSAEIVLLQENLNLANSQLNNFQMQIQDASEKDQSEKSDNNKVNEVLKLMKIKDLELEELRETIDRLETEKEDLTEEVKESMRKLQELQAVREQADAFKNTADLFEETKLSYDKVKEEEQILKAELNRVKSELEKFKEDSAHNVDRIQDLLDEKLIENSSLTEKIAEKNERIHALDVQLNEEKKMQEEVGNEFESMQMEVMTANEKIRQLSGELNALQSIITEANSTIETLQLGQQQKIQHQPKLTKEAELQADLASDVQDSISTGSIESLQAELETCRQCLLQWNTWSENKTAEYNQLLEAYNAYVEGYNNLSEELKTLKETTMASDNRDEVIAEMKLKLEEKEAELVSKTAEIARLNIRTHLGKLTVQRQEMTTVEPIVRDQRNLTVVKQEDITLDPDSSVVTLSVCKGSETSIEPEIQYVAATADWTESEGWGDEETTEGVSSVSQEVQQLETEISQLRHQLNSAEKARKETETELNNSKLKNGKMLVKVKTLTKELENFKSKKSGSRSGGDLLDDLDKAMEEEMNNQVNKAKGEVAEMKKELETLSAEKSALEKRNDTLVTANERLVEMKEKQDMEVEFLKGKMKNLSGEVDGLQWQLAEVEERCRNEVSELQVSLAVYRERGDGAGSDTGSLLEETATLRVQLESVASQLTAAQINIDTLREEVETLRENLSCALEEGETWRSRAEEAREEVESLKLHLDTLQTEKGGSEEGYEEARRLNQSLIAEIDGLRNQLLQQSPHHVTKGGGEPGENQLLREKVKREQQLVIQLERDLQNKESQLHRAREELEVLREGRRERRESSDSRVSVDREIGTVFQDQDLVLSENLRLRGELDTSVRENRRLASRIHSWQEELNRTRGVADEEGLRGELSQAIKTLQIKDHKLEELTQENVILLEERDMLQLKLSSLMRQQVESAANSRAMTPLPGGQPTAAGVASPVFDPQLQIRELHKKLEELRKLNYSLDVELQRERHQRENMQDRVMAPRNRQAAQAMETSDVEDSPIRHM